RRSLHRAALSPQCPTALMLQTSVLQLRKTLVVGADEMQDHRPVTPVGATNLSVFLNVFQLDHWSFQIRKWLSLLGSCHGRHSCPSRGIHLARSADVWASWGGFPCLPWPQFTRRNCCPSQWVDSRDPMSFESWSLAETSGINSWPGQTLPFSGSWQLLSGRLSGSV